MRIPARFGNSPRFRSRGCDNEKLMEEGSEGLKVLNELLLLLRETVDAGVEGCSRLEKLGIVGLEILAKRAEDRRAP